MNPKKQLAKPRPARLPYLLAFVVGVLAMRMSDVPATLWGKSLAAGEVGTLLCLALWRSRNARGLSA